MGLMGDRFEGTFDGHKIEIVRTHLDKHVEILVDGERVAEESVTLPHQWDRTTTFQSAGKTHSLVAHSTLKKLFGVLPIDNDYAIEIDGQSVPLTKVK